MNRESRFLSGKKQDKIRVVNFQPSVQSMREGEEVLFFNKNGSLSRYRKEKGLLWRSDMSNTGSQFVDNDLQVANKTTTGILEFKNKFIDYRYFKHNMTDDIGTSEVFLPWQGTGEQSDMDNATTAFLAPFKMSLEKILFRCETLTSTSADLRFKIYKQDNDTTNDLLATATYSDTIASSTTFTLNRADFDSLAVVETGMKCGISIRANTDPSGSTDWWITSVWRVEVEI
jgi:hypothetical protein